MVIERGDIVIVDLRPSRGSEQGGVRPCMVLQNDLGNRFSPTTIIAPVTSKKFDREFSTNVELSKEDSSLEKDSVILLNQITTIDKERIGKKISNLNSDIMRKVDLAVKVSLGLN